MTDLLLVRHGEATHNLEGRLEGWGATPLTQTGQHQVRALARRLASWSPPIVRLYTSPLLRARQTADVIALELGLVSSACDDLKEINFGQINGLSLAMFRETLPDLFARWQDRTDLTFQYPGGEQRLEFFQRASRAMDDIAARHPDEQVVVVAHGGTLRAGLAHFFPRTMKDWWAYALHNASLTHARVGPTGSVLITLNDCQHLEGKESA